MDKHTPHFIRGKKKIPIKVGYKGLLERLNLKPHSLITLDII